MRDPARIERITESLRAIWEGEPDQRLGQLLINYVFTEIRPSPMFYVEDDVVEERLARLFPGVQGRDRMYIRDEDDTYPPGTDLSVYLADEGTSIEEFIADDT